MNLHMNQLSMSKWTELVLFLNISLKASCKYEKQKCCKEWILGEKCTLYHVKLSIAIFFNFEKKGLVFIFFTKCKLILNTMLSLKLT